MQGVDWFTGIVAFASVLVGALVTGYFSWRYYVWASKDLKQASEDLTRRYEELSQDVRQEVLSSQQQLRNTHVGLTPVGGHTRVSDVTVDEGSHNGAGSNTALYTRI